MADGEESSLRRKTPLLQGVVSATAALVNMEPRSKRQKTNVGGNHIVAIKEEDSKENVSSHHAAIVSSKVNAAGSDNKQDNDSDDDDDVMVVDAPPVTLFPAATANTAGNGSSNSNNNNNNGEIEVVGCTNQVRLPHLRQHCTEKAFVALSNSRFQSEKIRNIPSWAKVGRDGNAEICDFCYCYVCDTPAKDCQHWSSTDCSTAYHNHCHATDNGPLAMDWKAIRQLYKNQQLDRISELLKVSAPKMDVDAMLKAKSPKYLPGVVRVGAFPPTHRHASPFFRLLTKCRKCHWFSFTADDRPKSKPHTGSKKYDYPAEWCQGCGRVAANKYLNVKTKCLPYRSKPNDVYIGTKTIPFRIKVHDPRNMKKFQENWSKMEGTSPEWIYDEAEAEEDMFRHRLGTYPYLTVILASIPVLPEDKIPTDGSHIRWNMESVRLQMRDEVDYHGFDYDDDDYYDEFGDVEDANDSSQLVVRAEDTDAILVDKNAIRILQELNKFHSFGVASTEKPEGSIVGDLMAKWNRDKRCGEFVIRIYHRRSGRSVVNLGPLLAAWYDIPPFPLSSLAGGLKACSKVREDSVLWEEFPPFELTAEETKELEKSAKEEMNEAVANFNNQIDQAQAKLSLKSSLGDQSWLGGVCPSDTSFVGLLRRYFTEIIHARQSNHFQDFAVSWAGRVVGITSHHRTMHGSKETRFPSLRKVEAESFLRDEDIPLFSCNMDEKCITSIQQNTRSISGILVHLENLGHDEAPFVEGLNVELLPFQRQTLQWALERETTPGGLRSFLSAKLPSSGDLYYCPLFESVCNKKPALVRGGIIADEMGLGKTVVSLALILQNPAPLEPKSGTESDSHGFPNNPTDSTGWDGNWRRGDDQNPLLASIISRGTLVVCHVSLVSQWIDEAKSKLDNPGLVYAYHGQNRKRDAMTLARNSIIVTTYATLAKDASYHAGKAMENGESEYCPPCEQIRWWRIICDESHSLKQDTMQTKAVMNLVGDHKWAVSGTPWTTSLADIKNQLKFVGLEDVDQIFNEFQNSVFYHVNNSNRRGCNSNRKRYSDERGFSHFVFLMRAVMIRHAQNQQYRGTPTTLMSLPPKTERTIMIDFDPPEAAEYASIEKDALDFYNAFKDSHSKELSSHYLLLIQKLTPLRIACAGGKIPVAYDSEDGDQNMDDAVVPKKKKGRRGKYDEEAPKAAKPKGKKVQTFSEITFQSKFNILIEELKKIRDNEPDSKSLVFSQYASSLKFLQEELPTHGFQFRTISGDMTLKQRAESLHAFQHDPPTTVFLLSMRSGAVGINLTQANRVFFLEPAMNPSLEAQAVGRVHRLGQTRNVEIVHLLMKDSIDIRVRQLVKTKYSRLQSSAVKKVKNVGKKSKTSPSVAVANAPIVGSMRTDKATIMGEEFDFLFGLMCSLRPSPFMNHSEDDVTKNEDNEVSRHSDSNGSSDDDSNGSSDDNDDDDNFDDAPFPDRVKSEN